MAFWIAVELLNVEALDLEVEPERRTKEVKQQIREMHMWATTVVELLVGDKKLRPFDSFEGFCYVAAMLGEDCSGSRS